MVIILVHWLVRPGYEEMFKRFWCDMNVPQNEGLYREILTEPSALNDPKFNTFSLTDRSYSTFINIGLWRSVEDFDNIITKRYILPAVEAKNPKTGRTERIITLDEFEFKIRERIVLKIISDRDGGLQMPKSCL
jgi:hypothetical protein